MLPCVCCLHRLSLLSVCGKKLDLVCLQSPVTVFKHILQLFAWGFARSFWRAGAAGDELKEEVLDRLLEVLSAGDILSLSN